MEDSLKEMLDKLRPMTSRPIARSETLGNMSPSSRTVVDVDIE
jgi:hypothetical protein